MSDDRLPEQETTFDVSQPATVTGVRGTTGQPTDGGWRTLPLDPPVSVKAGETVALSIPRTLMGPTRTVEDGDTLSVRGPASEVLERRTYQDGAFRPVVEPEP